MQELRAMQRLASAAAQLCAAHEELAAAGYESWSQEIRQLIDIIDAEVDWILSTDFSARIAFRNQV